MGSQGLLKNTPTPFPTCTVLGATKVVLLTPIKLPLPFKSLVLAMALTARDSFVVIGHSIFTDLPNAGKLPTDARATPPGHSSYIAAIADGVYQLNLVPADLSRLLAQLAGRPHCRRQLRTTMLPTPFIDLPQGSSWFCPPYPGSVCCSRPNGWLLP
jgi:hypothetical protein